MLRTNLSNRPFYNDRGIRAAIAAVAIVALGLTVFNAAEVYRLQSQNRELGPRSIATSNRRGATARKRA